jgi:hypothetical protein
VVTAGPGVAGRVVAGWASDGVADAAAGGADVVTAGVDDGAAGVAELPPAAHPVAWRAADSPAAATAVILVTGCAASRPAPGRNTSRVKSKTPMIHDAPLHPGQGMPERHPFPGGSPGLPQPDAAVTRHRLERAPVHPATAEPAQITLICKSRPPRTKRRNLRQIGGSRASRNSEGNDPS